MVGSFQIYQPGAFVDNHSLHIMLFLVQLEVCHRYAITASVHDLTADWLREVSHDVVVEPCLQPLSGETLRGSTINR